MTHDPTVSAPPPDPSATVPPGLPPTATADPAVAVGAPNPDAATTIAPQPHRTPAVDAPPGFVIERELGVGGMGVVYLARQKGLNRPVALKLVKAGAVVDGMALIRFLAEAEAVASIKHPNVVEVYQYGEHAGKPYMALEFCPGGDLTTLVNPGRQAGGASTRDAAHFRRIADLMTKVADGVNAAHELGIVHRDLKPHNVFLTADGTPKVADFGLAKRGVGSNLTNTLAVMGTPAYMAPEQAGGRTKFVGPEADVWALGVMLYELCCGERPIDTSGPLMDVLARVARADVSHLRTKSPAIPPDLTLIAHKCLSADPRDRYPTAGGLAADLRNWLDGKPISARKAGVIEQAVKWAKRNKRLAGMAAAVLLTMTVATAVSFGFGLETNKQADIARQEKKNADEKSEKLATALNDLSAASERTNRLLAKALLGPMLAQRSEWTGFERNSLWELCSLRQTRVPSVLFEEATGDDLTMTHFLNAVEYLDHAGVGLDSKQRLAADAVLAVRFNDGSLSDTRRLALVTVSSRTGRHHQAEDVTRVLLDLIEREDAPSDPKDLAVRLAEVCRHLPEPRARAACGKMADVLVAAVKREEGVDFTVVLVEAFDLVCDHLPVERVIGECKDIAELLYGRMKQPGNREGTTQRGCEALRSLALRLARVADRATVADAGMAFSAAADLHASALVADAGRISHAPPDLFNYAGDGFAEWARQFVRAAERLEAPKAVAVGRRAADTLAREFAEASGKRREAGKLLSDLAEGVAAVTDLLPREEAEHMCRECWRVLGDEWRRRSGERDQGAVTPGLAASARRLPVREAVELIGGIRPERGDVNSSGWQTWAGLMSATAQRMPADEGAEVLGEWLAKTPSGDVRAVLLEGLVEVARRLPPDRAAKIHSELSVEFSQDLKRAVSSGGVATVAKRLVRLSDDLSPELRLSVCRGLVGPVAAALSREWDSRISLAEVLALLAARLPTDEVIDLVSQAVDKCEDKFERRLLAKTVMGVLRGANGSKGDDLRRRAANALAADMTGDSPEWHAAPALAAVAERLPLDERAEVCRKVVNRMVGQLPVKRDRLNLMRQLEDYLPFLTAHLPADAAEKALGAAAAQLMTALESGDRYDSNIVANQLTAVACGLPWPALDRRKQAPALAALAGSATLHPDVLPKPRPLPPQQLVELLKHPFCVMEARRAVLDALEFTYDRKFADLWEFVAFAEKEHPELDLLTPPKRPEKK